jgi:hypothetical protein
MSAKIMGEVFELDIPQPDAWVLMAMADHADHRGANVYPSVALIAAKTGYSERQTQRIIKSLELAKILIREKEGNGRGNTAVFRIQIKHVKRKEFFTGEPPERVTDNVTLLPETERVTFENGKGDISDIKGDIQMSPQPSQKEPSERTITFPAAAGDKDSKEKASPSQHQVFIERWCDDYLKIRGEKYLVTGGKDGQAVKRLLAVEPDIDLLMKIARGAWKHPDLFHCKNSFSICGFVSRFNDIRAELRQFHIKHLTETVHRLKDERNDLKEKLSTPERTKRLAELNLEIPKLEANLARWTTQ